MTNETTLRGWLFGDGAHQSWIQIAKDELAKCKPVAGEGVWNSSSQDCEASVRINLHNEIALCYDEYSPSLHNSNNLSALKVEIEAVTDELLTQAIKETAWWTDSDALFAETGLRHG